MKGRTVAAASVAVSIGLIAFILVQVASIQRDGVRVGVSAASACSEPDEECLPELAMEDTEGNVWEYENLAGKVVIINFWATWCRPCLGEIPDLAQFHDDYTDRDVVLLGVMTDSPPEDEYEEFAKRTGLDYPVVRATADILRGFELPDVLPTTLVYDRGGRQVFRHQGAVTAEQLSELVEEYLAQEPPAPGAVEPGEGAGAL